MIIRRRDPEPKLLPFLIFIILVGLSSCRTALDLPASRLKPMPAAKLIDRAQENAFDFNDLSIRRINVQFSDENNRTSFRANLKATRDEKILASVSKLNIPVARVLLTPDRVTFVNYIDKNYFEGDYSYLSAMVNFGLNFNMVQAVISNPVKTEFADLDNDYRSYDTSVEDGKYVLQPSRRSNRAAAEKRNKLYINPKNFTKSDGEELMIRKLVFNPTNFVLEKMIMDNLNDDKMLEVDFYDFEKVDTYDYPGSIDIKMISGNELTELNIRLKGFSTDKVEPVNLSIPNSYQRIGNR